jgi:hypothetical protein
MPSLHALLQGIEVEQPAKIGEKKNGRALKPKRFLKVDVRRLNNKKP